MHLVHGPLGTREAQATGADFSGTDDPRLAAFARDNLVVGIDAEIALASTRLDFRGDPADELIAATSVVLRAPLLTRDERILSSKLVPLVRT